MTPALLLIDIQNDYFATGKMPLSGMEKATIKAGNVLKSFREKRLPIFHIQHISTRPGATFFLPDTDGVKIHEEVSPAPLETVIQKNFPNSFRETLLLDKLRENNVVKLVIAGAMSHMCIDATTRAAFDHGFHCTVIEDACATRNLAFDNLQIPAEHVHASFMSALGSVYARVVSSDNFSLDDV